ncbi:MAG: Nif3-like dinuclear metal center hexameric protein [Waddliaceae bacterium]|nr:Nif3-like dinuclear metal center hexameric protein [Waddliaceae bacterium]
MSLQELCTYLDDLLEAKLIKDFCPNGLQVEGKKEIKKVAVAVSASLKTIELFVESGAEALIVHHGMFWNRDDYAITGTKLRKLQLLIENKLSLLGYHLPLDFHKELGNNYKAAQDMGWKDLQPFTLYEGYPCGVMGTFSPISVQEFQDKLETYYKHPAHVALGGKERICSAALISGGAHKQIYDAVRCGVDCFITGSFDEPIWHAAHEEGIHFMAMGHSATETVGPKAIGQRLHEKFGLEWEFLDVPNPF